MKKADLIKVVATEAGLTNENAKNVVEILMDTIEGALVKGEEVNIQKFGKFSITNRAARKGVNPRTREEIEIPATKSVNFSASDVLKSKVKEG